MLLCIHFFAPSLCSVKSFWSNTFLGYTHSFYYARIENKSCRFIFSRILYPLLWTSKQTLPAAVSPQSRSSDHQSAGWIMLPWPLQPQKPELQSNNAYFFSSVPDCPLPDIYRAFLSHFAYFRYTKTTTGTTTKLFIRPDNLRVLVLGFIVLLPFQPVQ